MGDPDQMNLLQFPNEILRLVVAATVAGRRSSGHKIAAGLCRVCKRLQALIPELLPWFRDEYFFATSCREYNRLIIRYRGHGHTRWCVRGYVTLEGIRTFFADSTTTCSKSYPRLYVRAQSSHCKNTQTPREINIQSDRLQRVCIDVYIRGRPLEFLRRTCGGDRVGGNFFTAHVKK
jgi:hypothetical protein